MNITYRQAHLQDAQVLDQINRLCLPENYPIDQWKFLLLGHSEFCFVATSSDIIIGYCICVYEDKKGMIASIAVLPEYRNKGVGKNLLVKAMVAFKKDHKLSPLFLHCRVSNDLALKFYKKLGFNPNGRIKGYYDYPKEDAYELVRL